MHCCVKVFEERLDIRIRMLCSSILFVFRKQVNVWNKQYCICLFLKNKCKKEKLREIV